MIKRIEKIVCLPYGVTVKIDLAFPIGDSPNLEAVNDDTIDNIFIDQIIRGVKSVTNRYARSPLPINFLEGQTIIVTTRIPNDIYGAFDQRTDIIYLEPDRLSIAYDLATPEFLFGHEMGHKFQKYRNPEEAYQEISNFFGISSMNTDLVKEVYSDITGNIVKFGYEDEQDINFLSGTGIEKKYEPITHLGIMLSPEEGSYIKKRVLHNIYHI